MKFYLKSCSVTQPQRDFKRHVKVKNVIRDDEEFDILKNRKSIGTVNMETDCKRRNGFVAISLKNKTFFR